MVKPKSSTTRLKPSGPGARRGRPDPRADQETRERILAAAHTVFLRKGTAGSRTQEIATEAGVNKALVHYYFGTKAALADAIFERALGEIAPKIFGILSDPRAHHRAEDPGHRPGADRLPLRAPLLRRLHGVGAPR